MRCPICKTKMKCESYYDSDIHMNVEEYETCKDGCRLYDYEYAYGNGRERIGNIEFYYWHSERKARRRKRTFIRKQVISRIRKAWRKGDSDD